MVRFSDRVRGRVRRHVVQPFEQRVRVPVRRWRNGAREYRPIFVAGASGSGTSLLAVALGQRFECAGVVYEMDAQVSERSFLHVPSPDSFASVAEYERFIAPSDSWSVEEGRRDLQDLFRSYGSGVGDTIIAKGPDINLVRAGFLARCFPDARFLLVFRDPVANLEGWRRKWAVFADAELSEIIRFYGAMHERFLAAVDAPPERVLIVRYEALVEDPDRILGSVGERLGLVPATRPRRIPTRPSSQGMGIRNVRRSQITFMADTNRRSYDRIDPDTARTIQDALDPLHRRLRDRAL